MRILKVLLISFCLILIICGSAASATKYMVIGTGGPGATYFPLGGVLSKILNTNIEDLSVAVQPTGSSVDTSRRVARGDIDLGFGMSDAVFGVFNDPEFKEGSNLRVICSLYSSPLQIITLDKYNIKSVKDLKGKAFSVGPVGSGAAIMNEIIMKMYGLTYDDIKKFNLSHSEGAQAIQDGHIVAVGIPAAPPIPDFINLAEIRDVDIVETVFGEEMEDELIKEYPFYFVEILPAGTYKGVDEPKKLISVANVMVCNKDMPEDLVYEITKLVVNNPEEFEKGHVSGKYINLKTALDGIPIQLHPGAQRYYEEIGKEIPDNIKAIK